MKTYSYLLAGLFLLYESSYVVVTAEPRPIEYRGIIQDVNNLTAAVQLISDATFQLLYAFKENASRMEITELFDGVMRAAKNLGYSKNSAQAIPLAGRNFKILIEEIEEALQGLPTTNKLLLQLCTGYQKKYVVDPNVKKNFHGAVEYCNNMTLESATVETKQDYENVMKVLNKTCDGKVGRFWSSGSKLGDGKTWKWLSTGKKVPFFKWGQGEPNDSGGHQNCMEFYVNYYPNDGIYDDDECHYEYPPVCQIR